MTNTTKWVGAPLRRREDKRFLTGQSQYTDDMAVTGQAYAVFVRSPHAHAKIAGVQTAQALRTPGVRLIVTAADIDAELVGPLPSHTNTPPFDVQRNGGAAADGSQPPLATDTVRYLGEPVVMVVADSLNAARDAADHVMVDYEPLTSVMEFEQALADGAQPVWDDAPDNVSFDWAGGDPAATHTAFADAAHVTRLRLVNNRVVIAFMEPRAALADIDTNTGRLTLFAGCQGAHGLKAGLVDILRLSEDQLRVVVPDTGGGFGARGSVYPEFPVLLIAARRLGRAIKWTAERTESFLTDTQSRDHVMYGELALDSDGRMLAIRA
ncbi:MAG: molybdopterin-dependent oxidoreductase, partial [Gammaproteobacteria bacterium]|nr:molybdopterin-dependent oxidoreductase [Gammaproteobacteria bacterium]